jgi:hypothetical protein
LDGEEGRGEVLDALAVVLERLRAVADVHSAVERGMRLHSAGSIASGSYRSPAWILGSSAIATLGAI